MHSSTLGAKGSGPTVFQMANASYLTTHIHTQIPKKENFPLDVPCIVFCSVVKNAIEKDIF